ncbi:MAG: archease [Acidobacteriaceae bacterium]|nr:archease [Acidobacteriaceae bacterium]
MLTQFEILEHPADIGFRAYGQSLEELFANCAHALISIIFDPADIALKHHWELEAESSDLESLLVNWLNEVLFYVDTRRTAFRSLAVSFPRSLQVSCAACGELRDPVKHPVRLSVKAVTYHQLKISRVQESWYAEVYVDI